MSKRRPLLITFEGGEGVGKSTLIHRFYDQLKLLGYPVVQTREPGGSLLGEQVRHLLLHQDKYPICSMAEILLFLTSRAQQIHEFIRPHLDQGYVVLCDRYNDSTVAYQGIARGIGQKLTEELCAGACQHLTPDMTFVLDLDPKKGLERTHKMNKEWDRLESLDFSFHEKVRKAYLKLAHENPTRIVVVQADDSKEQVFKTCWDALHRKFLA